MIVNKRRIRKQASPFHCAYYKSCAEDGCDDTILPRMTTRMCSDDGMTWQGMTASRRCLCKEHAASVNPSMGRRRAENEGGVGKQSSGIAHTCNRANSIRLHFSTAFRLSVKITEIYDGNSHVGAAPEEREKTTIARDGRTTGERDRGAHQLHDKSAAIHLSSCICSFG